jgi:hypothetical protein
LKTIFSFADQPGAALASRSENSWSLLVKFYACVLVSAQVLSASPSAGELSALPESIVAANFATTLTSAAIPVRNSPALGRQVTISLIEAGFLIGTTTAVHELGHARRVLVAGGHSQWETGDVNWWSYFTHRDPLSAGSTAWQLPQTASLDDRISILTGGFNATTAWDESAAGHGPLGLVTARYSTLLYELAGVNSSADDLAQIVDLYRIKGYRVSRRELQIWQLLAGFISQTNSSVRTYAYFTPKGVSVRAVTRWNGWTLATEAVVHGASTVEVEVGRRLYLGAKIELLPKLLVSAHGLGGSLKAGARFRQTTISIDGQFVNASTLLGARATTNFNLEVTTRI